MLREYFLGGYTRKENKGIHIIGIDSDSSELKYGKLIIEENNPTYLTYDSDAGILHTVTAGKGCSGVAAYRVSLNGEQTEAELISRAGAFDVGPCHISLSDDRSLVVAAVYHEGRAHIFKNKDGHLSYLASVKHNASGPVSPNQDSSRSHFMSQIEGTDYLAECDLGGDRIYVYRRNHTSPMPAMVGEIKLKAGVGPRHFVYRENDKGITMYVACELSRELAVVRLNRDMRPLGEPVYYSPDEHLKSIGGASASAIRLLCANNGDAYIYMSIRGDNVIVVYRLNSKGEPEFIQCIDTHGSTPRDFNISSDGAQLLCAHRDDDVLSVFDIDAETGELTLTSEVRGFHEKVCVEPIK